MYDEDDEEFQQPVRRMRTMDLLLMPLVLIHNVVEAIGDWLTDVVLLVKAHDEWKVQQTTPIEVTT